MALAHYCFTASAACPLGQAAQRPVRVLTLLVEQSCDSGIVHVLVGVVLAASVYDLVDSFAVHGLYSQLNSIVADHVRILSYSAVEPLVANSVEQGSAGVEANNYHVLITAVFTIQVGTVSSGSEHAVNGTGVGAEYANGVALDNGLSSGLAVSNAGGSSDSYNDLNGYIAGTGSLVPYIVAGYGYEAGLSSFAELEHLLNETGGTAGDGSGSSILADYAEYNRSINGSSGYSSADGFDAVHGLCSQSAGSGVISGSGGEDGSLGSVGYAGVKADYGYAIGEASVQLLGNGLGIKSCKAESCRVLGQSGVKHVYLLSDVGLGRGTLKGDLYAILGSGILGALIYGLPELVLEALGYDGYIGSSFGSGFFYYGFLNGSFFYGGSFLSSGLSATDYGEDHSSGQKEY